VGVIFARRRGFGVLDVQLALHLEVKDL